MQASRWGCSRYALLEFSRAGEGPGGAREGCSHSIRHARQSSCQVCILEGACCADQLCPLFRHCCRNHSFHLQCNSDIIQSAICKAYNISYNTMLYCTKCVAVEEIEHFRHANALLPCCLLADDLASLKQYNLRVLFSSQARNFQTCKALASVLHCSDLHKCCATCFLLCRSYVRKLRHQCTCFSVPELQISTVYSGSSMPAC